ncbi:MAG: tRNA lysidine(34) synthetase TilS [Burkholderiaceae bacterium]
MSHALLESIRAFTPALPLAVAYSGGADSTALLLACAQKWPGQVIAIHVHHGLQAAADNFERHCQHFCRELGVPLRVQRVNAQAASGQSPEDAARRARYAAFAVLVKDQHLALDVQSIALAQHADDQVETLVLALSRGAGLPGLSGMAASWQRDGLSFHRPLLNVPGADLRDWLRQRHVDCIEDPTNADQAFTRNRIRALLLPVLATAFPQFRQTFARSASHAAQAQTLLLELAQQDLLDAGPMPVIKKLQALSRVRQANLIRYWLKQTYQVQASTAQLEELLDQIEACTTRGHQIQIKVGGGVVQRQGEQLDWYNR